MKVVVTGASGFLGTEVIRAMAERSDVTVVGVSRRDVPGVCRVGDYSESPIGEVLVHLAEDSDRARVATSGVVYEQQVHSTLLALLRKGFRRVVYASSALLYGDSDTHPHSPSDPVRIDDAYTRVKRRSEIAVLETPAGVVVRLANVYGPGMAQGSVMSAIVRQIPGAGPVSVLDTGPVRDFLWVGDAVEGIVALATLGDDQKGGVFNLGTGAGTSIGALARMALEIGGQPERSVVAKSSAGRRSTVVLDYASTTMVCGWRPITSLPQGLTRLMTSGRGAT